MILFIKTNKIHDNTSFIAEVDWSKGDAGNVGTPGAVKYGDTEKEAKTALKTFLESQGHIVKECCVNSNVCQELDKCMYEGAKQPHGSACPHENIKMGWHGGHPYRFGLK